jgi:hypothetical protein
VCQISRDETIDNKPILALSENALKLIYGNVEFQNFLGEDPASSGEKGKEGGVEESRGVGRVGEGDDEVGRRGAKGRTKGKGIMIAVFGPSCCDGMNQFGFNIVLCNLWFLMDY